ncbi:DUF721 domain-containing protein [Larsenimonas salina]|uniref:DUF721 domain-containing protein n=1 Tax=Larsenimonas salina TaxID=1295565 RepID=UPI0020745FDA|nr:DciA family protein [Larsenimonas salina]MCM5703152.1 DciA family protein [Larsenimonas salina]
MALLMKKAHLLGLIQDELETLLPDAAKGHVFVGGYSEGRLTLMTNRAAHLTWLRYEQLRLLTHLKKIAGLEALMGFNLKVRPIRTFTPPPAQPRRMDEQAAANLKACAEEVSDKRLRSSLERLAKRAENLDDSL